MDFGDLGTASCESIYGMRSIRRVIWEETKVKQLLSEEVSCHTTVEQLSTVD